MAGLIARESIPGADVQSDAAIDDALQAAAEALGYPVLVKAAGGGGGRGMRVVAGAGALAEAIAGARLEAAHAFGDPTVFLEKYVARGRHIEFQVFGDAHGQVLDGSGNCAPLPQD